MLTQERLKEVLHYNPETGIFKWRIGRMGRGCVEGQIVGSDNGEGYLRVMVDGKRYKLHRLAVFYMTGKWPEDRVDHKDTMPGNNRWLNLRDADSFINAQNQRRPQSRNSTGFLGVTFDGTAFIPKITFCGQRIPLGRFSTGEAAHDLYVRAKRVLHPGCTL